MIKDYYSSFFKKINLMEVNKMKKIICVDGVVGVGKSSLGKILAEKYDIILYEEPVLNNPILDKYYYDRKRWSFPLQIFFLNKRFKMLKEANKLGRCVMDRSIYGDVIFSKMLVEDGDMSKEEFELYEELLYNMLEHVEKPTLMIYLETSVDSALKKIKKRGRDYEQIVPREYWESLDNHYREYFNNYNISDIIKINVDEIDFVNNLNDRKYILDLIDEKLKSIEKK